MTFSIEYNGNHGFRAVMAIDGQFRSTYDENSKQFSFERKLFETAAAASFEMSKLSTPINGSYSVVRNY